MNLATYVIHLPNPERKARITAELAGAGCLKVKFVHAQEPVQGFTMSNMRRNPRGEFGCALSHVKAIMQAVVDDVDEALFIEDDIIIGRPAHVSVPPDWKVFYFGGHPREPVQRVSEGVYRVGRFSCAEAYMLNRKSMWEFLQFWCDRAGQPDAMFDFILGEYAAMGGGYAMYPTLTRQLAGFSHIGQKFDDKGDLIERGWRNNLAA